MAGQFAGKVAIVTGASQGIGKGIALAFAREGADTVIVSSSAPKLSQAATDIATATGNKPEIVAADLKTEPACRSVFDFVEGRYGRADILVNSAGATRAGDFLTMPDEVWMDGFALKYLSCVRLSRLFWPLLSKAGGNIVNIDGGASRTPNALFLIGGSVNAAMANFSKGLSKRGIKDNVNVNVIHPGSTQTERAEVLLRQRAEADGITIEQARARSIEESGLRRIATPNDIAALTLFLCSDAARHIQGTAIAVDGGGTPGYY